MSEEVLTQTNSNSTQGTKQPRRRFVRLLGITFIITAVLLGYFLTIAYLGWRSGQTLLIEKRETQLTDEINKQMMLARIDIADGRYALAEQRLHWVIERSPNQPDAQTLLIEAQNGLNNVLTPQPIATALPTPSQTPLPTPAIIDNPQTEFERLRRLTTTERWEEAVGAIIAFQRQFPNYERPETDQMLYDAYINNGLALVTGNDIELGLFYLTQAEKLGDLPQDVIDHETWAELYLQGIAFYGTNWGASVYYFRDLCLAAPFYQSSCERLYEVLLAYGDQYVAGLDWCPAQQLYEEAQLHGRSVTLIEKLQLARENCLLATPTPLAPITNTLPISSVQPIIVPDTFVIPTAVAP